MADAKVACRTPNPGRDGATNIPAWKFDALRTAILDALGPGPMRWSDLTDAVRARLPADTLEKLGNPGWHVVTVKLELEVRGEIERIPGAKPQMLRRVTD